MRETYDIIVLGGGPAGRPAAIIARRSGASVLLVEEERLGGTCPLKGCIPKKVLLASTEIMESIRRAPEHRVTVRDASLDWGGLFDLKRATIDPIPREHEQRLKNLGIQILYGRARLNGPGSVEVDGRTYHGKKIVIATGSRPRMLPVPGFETTLTSDDLLELDRRPSSILFIGGGPVGMEFAHIFLRAGVAVTVLDAAKKILPAFDEDLVRELVTFTHALGAQVIPGVQVDSISRTPAGFNVTYRNGGRSVTVESDLVVNSAGRAANYDGLNLEAAGVEYDDRGIILDRYLRSVSNKNVFVAGDAVAASLQLSPVATHEGRIVAHNITSPENLVAPDYRAVPFVVYTIPPLAGVGVTEPEARNRGLRFKTAFHNLKSLMMAEIYAEPAVFSKLLIEKETNRIIGAHVLGHGAQEIINTFGLAMKHGITSRDLRDFLYAFPTFSADIPDMLISRG